MEVRGFGERDRQAFDARSAQSSHSQPFPGYFRAHTRTNSYYRYHVFLKKNNTMLQLYNLNKLCADIFGYLPVNMINELGLLHG